VHALRFATVLAFATILFAKHPASDYTQPQALTADLFAKMHHSFLPDRSNEVTHHGNKLQNVSMVFSRAVTLTGKLLEGMAATLPSRVEPDQPLRASASLASDS